MNKYNVEITDTFGGEANYSWVRRYSVTASTIRGAMRAVSNQYGGYWKKDFGDSDFARYNMIGACIAAFIEICD